MVRFSSYVTVHQRVQQEISFRCSPEIKDGNRCVDPSWILENSGPLGSPQLIDPEAPPFFEPRKQWFLVGDTYLEPAPIGRCLILGGIGGNPWTQHPHFRRSRATLNPNKNGTDGSENGGQPQNCHVMGRKRGFQPSNLIKYQNYDFPPIIFKPTIRWAMGLANCSVFGAYKPLYPNEIMWVKQ